MRSRLAVPFGVLSFAVLAGALFLLRDVPSVLLPQRAAGGSVLDVAFGDARAVLSRSLVHKADSYFHGGVDMACEECHHHDHGPCEATHHQHETSYFDPWRWINARVRAPEVERHLEGMKAVEMLPWLWAAVRSDPHNDEAWTAAWYVAAHAMRDESLAQRILDEAKAKNPESAEIWFTQGRFLYKLGKGDVPAAKAAFGKAKAILLAACGNDPARLSERDRRLYDFTCNYLRKIP